MGAKLVFVWRWRLFWFHMERALAVSCVDVGVGRGWCMSETMRDAKIDWIQSVLGLDLRVARADAGQDRPTAGDDAPKRHASGRKPKRKQEMVAAPILGSMQQKRAEALKAALSPADRKTIRRSNTSPKAWRRGIPWRS